MNTELGATGRFPDGKLNKDDEGELQFGVGSNPEKRLVALDFNKPVSWLAMPPEAARALAALLLHHAGKAEGKE